MKRNSNSCLVDYPSSDEDQSPPPIAQSPPIKKRKNLPAIGDHLQPDAPVDNPALHLGRRRTTPHVEGQFAAYVYVPLLISKQSQLYPLLTRIYATAKLLVPSLHPIGFEEEQILNSGSESLSSGSSDASIELHISLTRPTYLRAHQREEFKRALKSLVQNLAPALRAIRQKEFYDDPRFHASIAWALLEGPKAPRSPITQNDIPSESSQPSVLSHDAPAASQSPGGSTILTSIAPEFPTIPCFPPSLIPQLQAEFCSELVRRSVGTFEAEEVHVRIGKEISKWRLSE
ncbi:hypothetical protein GSI_10407 [Ganoderma sinense ZZ0214-1]|uniref:U6 snRNA phosphodiesterase 1 n=1 Tax=Ganoderma sinense ZZ0214-1 TaxID=1077348 RepID=A0A2G8S0G5_9APHY|nr:hypothetical protein GSI_10407 [Ganoderma sinense ZZ0214-1]